MKTQNFNIYFLTIFLSLFSTACSKSNETVMEKIGSRTEKLADGAKEMYSDTKDGLCKMVNGELECAAKKLKNEIKSQSKK